MEALEATFTQFKALIVGDTGAGGLSNATGDQYIRGGVIRETDIQAKGTPGRPCMVVDIVPEEIGHEASGRSFQALIRARIRSDRDRGIAEQDAITGRLVDLCNGVALATGSTGWAFSTMTLLRTPQVENDKEVGPIVEFQVIATK